MKQSLMSVAIAGAALTLVGASQASAADPIGVWMDDTGRGAVEIKTCGSSLCGFVVAVKNDNDTKGCGRQIIGDAQSIGSGVWGNGWIYSPEKRRNYDVEIKPLNATSLRIVGYAGTKFFSKTMIWKRAPDDLKLCASAQSAQVKTAQPTVAVAKDSVAPPQPTSTPVVIADPALEKARPATAGIAAPSSNAKSETEQVDSTKEPSETDAAQTAETESRDDASEGEQPGQRTRRGGLKLSDLKLGDLDLEKVLSRTDNGDCKLDLPWVKVQFDCKGR